MIKNRHRAPHTEIKQDAVNCSYIFEAKRIRFKEKSQVSEVSERETHGPKNEPITVQPNARAMSKFIENLCKAVYAI